MNKIAVVTGASYGLGDEISNRLITLGFKVYGLSRTEPKIKHKQFIWIQADLLNDSQMPSVLAQIKEDKIDILVNNAGVAFFKKTLEYTDKDFDRMFGLNFKAHVKITQQLFAKLTGGLIITISSLSDRYPDPMFGLYGSSKTALNIFFETMAAENTNVKIINILPSYVDTPMQHGLHDNTNFDWSICMKPIDIANAIENVITNVQKIESGSRIIVEKTPGENAPYNPEKLWVYSALNKVLNKISR